MTQLTFTTNIKATKDKVWEILWNDATYREWTRVFSEGSYAVSDWKEGSKVQFLSNDGDGMYSIIEKSSPGRYMSFKHLGVVKMETSSLMMKKLKNGRLNGKLYA